MIPKHLIDNRIETLQARLQEEGIDGALILKPQNSFYLSGFNPVIQSQPVAVFLPPRGPASLILHALRYPHALAEAGLQNFVIFGRWGRFGTDAPADIFGALAQCLARSAAGASRFWIEESHIPVSFFRKLQAMLPSCEFVDMTPELTSLRRVKAPEEIELIEKAAGLADVGMDAAIAAIGVGVTEAEVSARSMAAMQMAWQERHPELEPVDFGLPEGGVLNALWTYCLSGDRMNMMCDGSKERRIQDGDLVLVVIWTALNGYHAENERTIAVGRLRDRQEHAFQTILRAREEAAALIRPGTPLSEIYRAATGVMAREGFGSVLPGRVGHGLGLGAHEPPSFGPDEAEPMEEGMVMSFEPAIRIGNLGGVQHSDTIVVTHEGFRFLTHTDRGQIVVGA